MSPGLPQAYGAREVTVQQIAGLFGVPHSMVYGPPPSDTPWCGESRLGGPLWRSGLDVGVLRLILIFPSLECRWCEGRSAGTVE